MIVLSPYITMVILCVYTSFKLLIFLQIIMKAEAELVTTFVYVVIATYLCGKSSFNRIIYPSISTIVMTILAKSLMKEVMYTNK